MIFKIKTKMNEKKIKEQAERLKCSFSEAAVAMYIIGEERLRSSTSVFSNMTGEEISKAARMMHKELKFK